MDFDLRDEQRQLQESLGRVLAEHCSFEARQRHVAEPEGFVRAMWARYAELGLLGLPLAEAHGGFGGDASDTLLVMEALGRVMAAEPYLATVVLGATAIARGGTDAQQSELLPRISDGGLLLAWAHSESGAWHDPAVVTTRAARKGGDWQLTGAKTMVLHGAAADLLVVSARVRGAADETDGLALFLVDGTAPGLKRRSRRLIDQSAAAELALDATPAVPLGRPGDAWPVIEAVVHAGIAAVCAQSVGAMQAALDLTVNYLKTREQFGRAIGGNQALQHRAAEMLTATEQARSMAMLAAMMVDDAEAPDRVRQLSMAKLVVSREGRSVAQQAVQLHGGIGVTTEYAIGHYMRYLTVAEQLFGDTAWHLRRVAGLSVGYQGQPGLWDG